MIAIINIISPFLISIMAVYLSYIPYEWGVLGIVRIDFAMIVLFYWYSRRDDSVPYLFVLFLGLLADALQNSPFGAHAMAYLLISFIVLYAVEQKVFSTVFGWYFSGIISILLGNIILWFSGVFQDTNVIYDMSYLFSAGLTIGVFPILIFLFNRFFSMVR